MSMADTWKHIQMGHKDTVYKMACVCVCIRLCLFLCLPSRVVIVPDHPRNTHTHTLTHTSVDPVSLPVVIMSPCVWSTGLLIGGTCNCEHIHTHLCPAACASSPPPVCLCVCLRATERRCVCVCFYFNRYVVTFPWHYVIGRIALKSLFSDLNCFSVL